MLKLRSQEQQRLLRIAREAVGSHLGAAPLQKPKISGAALSEPCGVFVSIYRETQLRGCVGRVEAEARFMKRQRNVPCRPQCLILGFHQ